MLTRVAIHNFHCFVDFELKLPRRLLLVGSNGSGKTSLWKALAGLQDVIVRGADVADLFPTPSRTRWLADVPVQSFALELQLGDDTYTYTLELLHDVPRRKVTIHHEHLTVGNQALYEQDDRHVRLYGDAPDTPPRSSFPWGGKRSFLPDLESHRDRTDKFSFLSEHEPRLDITHILAFRDAIADLWLLAHSPQQIAPTTAVEAAWLERDGHNFASWFRGVLADRPEVGTLLNEALRPTIPGLRKISFEKISSTIRELMLQFHGEGSDYTLSAGELSDGQRSLLLLHGLLVGALDRARLAFLDEPETGLAPHEMQPWLAAAAAALDAHDGQLFVISHHPAVIDYLAPERTLGFSRPHGGPTRIDDITLETTGGARVSEWLARAWAYEHEHDEPTP